MRSIFKEEIDIVWDNYDYLIRTLGFYKMVESSTQELQKLFTLKYKDLYFQVKNSNFAKGKTKNEVGYSILKLRRLIAVWNKNNIWKMNSGIHYSAKDTRNQFPKFDRQNPDVIPTERTIQRLQAKVLHQYIENHNNRVDELIANKQLDDNGKKPRYITNLRDLRLCLMSECKLDEELASELTRKYANVVAHKEVNDFSNQTDEINIADDEIVY